MIYINFEFKITKHLLFCIKFKGMKKSFGILCLAILSMNYGCDGDGKNIFSTKQKTTQNQIENSSQHKDFITSKISSCNIYFENYKKYTDEYKNVTQALSKNPEDSSLIIKVNQLTIKQKEFTNPPLECVSDTAFITNYTRLNTY